MTGAMKSIIEDVRRMINGPESTFARTLSKEVQTWHPSLQQGFARVMVHVLKDMADIPAPDQRNSEAVASGKL